MGSDSRGVDVISLVGCEIAVSNIFQSNQWGQPYPLRIPSNSTDGFPADVVQGQTLLLRFDIPNGHETSTATGNHDVGDFPVPVQAFNIVCASRIVSQPEWVLNVVQVGDEQLALSTTGGQEVRVLGVELESLDGAGVFRGPRHERVTSKSQQAFTT